MFTYKSKNITLLFHVLVWIVLFSFPYLLSSGSQEQAVIRVVAHSWVPLAMYALIFYVNYLYLINAFVFNKKKIVLFIVVNIVLIASCVWFRETLNELFFQHVFPKAPKGDDGPPVSLFIYVQILSFLIPILFALALKITERWIKTEAARKEAENIKLESELQHLKYQLQPHFFFNSLNNIYSLVDISPEQAKSTIHSLSKLMRYLLYETNTEKVPLEKEIDFMEKYIELMKLRLTDKTKVNYQFPDHVQSILISPLLFISLVENAFKHGVSASQECFIEFEMKLVEDNLTFTSKNFNYPKNVKDKSGSGIGLENLKKRLDLLYPKKHEFNFEVVDTIYISTLSINLA
ncbi:sensor histidine kinase [Neptunitalea lumnitzerae]|uniref:Histidine kinase n=1 Tax=Neptunitalea lumnitzerae TaxID=2965509 RepID=A0ABQ5MMD3_9FLAO|nr:histidine kinase [Neptunitalea sp. Y10]GLB50471.1 histidine kinase [Neptunitalea sp. Y10]